MILSLELNLSSWIDVDWGWVPIILLALSALGFSIQATDLHLKHHFGSTDLSWNNRPWWSGGSQRKALVHFSCWSWEEAVRYGMMWFVFSVYLCKIIPTNNNTYSYTKNKYRQFNIYIFYIYTKVNRIQIHCKKIPSNTKTNLLHEMEQVHATMALTKN